MTTPRHFIDVLKQHAAKKPDECAYLFLDSGDQTSALTFSELFAKAAVIAAALQERGAHDAGRALLLYQNYLEFVPAFLGCVLAKVVPVPVQPVRFNRDAARLIRIAQDAQCRYVLRASIPLAPLEPIFEALGDDVVQVDTEAIPLSAAERWREPRVDPEDLVLLQYTSGSTTDPRGVMVSHRNLMHNAQVIKEIFRQGDDVVAVGWLPFYHDMGLIGNVLQPLYLGVKSVLFSPVTFLQDPAFWLRAVSAHRATTSGGPNFAYDLCVRKIRHDQITDIDLSSWRIAFNGGEPVRADVIQRFIEKFRPYGFREEAFYPCYGLAEATLLTTGSVAFRGPLIRGFDEEALSRHRASPAGDPARERLLVSCGQPGPGQEVVIVDPETSRPLAKEEVGEIWVRGESVAKGYWAKPDLSAATFGAYLTDGRGPFLRTGDLGFLHEGELFITGRLKDLIIIRGRNHYPDDIEFTVRSSHEALGVAAAFTVEVSGEDRLVVVSEVRRHEAKELDARTASDIVRAARRNLSELHGLALHDLALIKPATLPKTSSGKIRRRSCREQYLAQSLDVVTPRAGEKHHTAVGF